MTVPVSRRPPILVMETGVNQVAGGGSAGWVSNTPANLGDGLSTNVVFDLGADWDQYPIFSLSVYSNGAVSLSAIALYGSDTAAINVARRLTGAYPNGANLTQFSATQTSAAGAASAMARPCGRYVVVAITNTAGSGAQGPTAKLTLAAYPS